VFIDLDRLELTGLLGIGATTAASEPLTISQAIGQPVIQMVLASLFVIYLASKIGGELTSRLGLTTILGELLAGTVVGISWLGLVVLPGAATTAGDSLLLAWLQALHGTLTATDLANIFRAQGLILSTLSQLGVILLLFQVGLESNLRELVRVAPQAATTVVAGVTIPLVVGLGGLLWLFGVEWTGALFAAASMTAVSIGISASILGDLGMLTSREGQVIIGAAVLDDILGILTLTVISGLLAEEISSMRIVVLISTAVLFLAGSTVFSRLLGSLFVNFLKPLQTRGSLLLLSLTFCFGFAFLADAVQLEALIGAFAGGLILSQTEVKLQIEKQLQPVADLLVPVFFVVTGAQIDLTVVNPLAPGGGAVLAMGIYLALMVILGRLTGAHLIPARQSLHRMVIGVGTLPLGEVALVIAGVGVASGRMSPQLSAAVILAILITVTITPIWLRAVLANTPLKS
jgi:Kef-type K+ transport system membrane component KefB